MTRRVLVVAGNVDLRAAVAQILQPAGYTVELADGEKRARALLGTGGIDAAIIAPASLGEHGQDFANELRATFNDVIVLADDADEDREPARPQSDAKGKRSPSVSLEHLLGCLSELLGKAKDGSSGPAAVELLSFEGRTVDFAGRTLLDAAGREVALTHAEFELLATFMRAPGRVLSRDQLRQAVAGRDSDAYDRSVDMLVARLRHKIELDPKNPRFIVTIPSEGYKFAVRPQHVSPTTIVSDAPVHEARQIATAQSERRHLTMLACRIDGLASILDPEDMQVAIAAVHRAIEETAKRFAGQPVFELLGDRFFVQFGYPDAQEDDAEQAVRAALELVRIVASADVTPVGRLRLRIGIASGVALVRAPQAHVAIGEPLTLALRLRSVARPGEVVVADSTWKLLGSFFDYEELPPLSPEEGLASIRAWRVTGEHAAAGRFNALRRAGMSALVDRDEQMELLLRRWRQAQSGAGQIVILTGEPGIGKSRLAAELQSRLGSEVHACLEYFGLPHQSDGSMFTLIDELQRASGFVRADDGSRRLQKLAKLLKESRVDDPQDLALMANLLSLPMEGPQRAAALTARERKERSFAALMARIDGLVARQPVLMVVEDIQWIDPTSLEFLTILGERLPSLAVLMVATARPGFSPPWRGLAHVTIVELVRLVRSDAEILVDRVAGKPLPKEVTNLILSPTEGVPLFVEELTKAVLEAGVRWQDGHQPDAVQVRTIPSTLHGSLLARLDRLCEAKEIAQIGAVIGREFSYELLHAVTRIGEQPLRQSLDRLCTAELVYCRGLPPLATYMFKHALVRDAAYGMLPRGRKQELHGAIAKAIEEGFAEIIETQPELVAHHYRQSGNVAKEAYYLATSAERALSHSALEEADRQIRRALELAATLAQDEFQWRLQLRLEMARARRVIEDKGYGQEQVGDAYGAALVLSNRVDDKKARLDALYGLWAHHYVCGEPVVMLDRANEFLAFVEQQDETGPIAVAYRLVGTSRLINGDIAGATEALREAFRRYDANEHGAISLLGRAFIRRFVQDVGVTVHSYLSWALWLAGRHEEAMRHARAAEQKGREAKSSGHTLSLLYALWHAGMAYALARDGDQVERVGRELSILANGRPYWLALGDFLLGWHARHSGRPAEAIEILKRGLKLWEATGSKIFRPICLAFLADAYAANEEPKAAKRAFEEALKITKQTGERWSEPEIRRLFGDLAVRCDDAAAIARYKEAIRVARDQRSPAFELRATTCLARALSKQGKRAEAVCCLSKICGGLGPGSDTPDIADARGLLEEMRSASPAAPNP